MTRRSIKALALAALALLALPAVAVTAEYDDTNGRLPGARITRGVALEAPYNKIGTEYGNSAKGGGYTLLRTIPAATGSRLGYLIQSQCTAGLLVSFEDVPAAGGGNAPAYFALAGAAGSHGQGGAIDMNGAPYTGQIKIYSSDAACVYVAWINQ